jgi:UPF0176 protein
VSTPPVRYLTAALYKFVALENFADLRAPLLEACAANSVKGTVLLADEGINGTIAGPADGVRRVLSHLRANPRLADLEHKESWSDRAPFHRLKVRLKREIVTLGVPGVSPVKNAGTYVPPSDWNALIADPEVVVIDTRNDYETRIGTFARALDPGLKSFGELPAWLAEHKSALVAADGSRPKIAMFCTGGIRCEKSTAYLRDQGFEEVFHLQGGILKYLEDVPPEDSLWEGDCFVFDERVAVGHGLTPSSVELCRACREPVTSTERLDSRYVEGVSCPHCADRRDDSSRARLMERQRQVELARTQGLRHVGQAREPRAKSSILPTLDDPPQRLRELIELAHTTGKSQLIGLIGMPGSGKSTLAAELSAQVGARPGSLIMVGMDGFHLTRAQLAARPNPEAQLARRGAPWTFDPAALKAALLALVAGHETHWPDFDHGVGDPTAGSLIPGQTGRVIMIEGLYLLHQDHGWELADLFNETWYLDVSTALARERTIGRHQRANGDTAQRAATRWHTSDRLNARLGPAPLIAHTQNPSFVLGYGNFCAARLQQPNTKLSRAPYCYLADERVHHFDRRFACDRYSIGAPGRIRTCDRRIRSPLLYPTELRGQGDYSRWLTGLAANRDQ